MVLSARRARFRSELAEELPDFCGSPAIRRLTAVREWGVATDEGAKLQRIACLAAARVGTNVSATGPRRIECAAAIGRSVILGQIHAPVVAQHPVVGSVRHVVGNRVVGARFKSAAQLCSRVYHDGTNLPVCSRGRHQQRSLACDLVRHARPRVLFRCIYVIHVHAEVVGDLFHYGIHEWHVAAGPSAPRVTNGGRCTGLSVLCPIGGREDDGVVRPGKQIVVLPVEHRLVVAVSRMEGEDELVRLRVNVVGRDLQDISTALAAHRDRDRGPVVDLRDGRGLSATDALAVAAAAASGAPAWARAPAPGGSSPATAARRCPGSAVATRSAPTRDGTPASAATSTASNAGTCGAAGASPARASRVARSGVTPGACRASSRGARGACGTSTRAGLIASALPRSGGARGSPGARTRVVGGRRATPCQPTHRRQEYEQAQAVLHGKSHRDTFPPLPNWIPPICLSG